MKFRYIFLAMAGLLTLGFASCEKAHEYEPAAPEGGNQVYFSKDLPASYDVKGLESFTVEVMRGSADGSLTVGLASEVSYPDGGQNPFTIPTEVTFAPESKTASIQIAINDTAILESVDYAIELALESDTTLYGKVKYAFTASIPASWTKFAEGHVYEVCWEEDYDCVMYTQETEFANILKCKLENAWNGNVGTADYLFYWNTETDEIFVPAQWIAYTGSGGQVWVSDAAGFYNLSASYGLTCPSEYWFSWAPGFHSRNGFFQPYYDGMGGFYLADWYWRSDGTTPTGNGYQFGDAAACDYFIAEGFVRTTDYNDDNHIGSSEPLYKCDVASMFYSEDGATPAIGSEVPLRCDAYDTTAVTTVYYLKDYFAEGHCLAFTAPVLEALTEEAQDIEDVDNDQATGINYFGAGELYVSIKKGSAYTIVDGTDTLPAFEITLKVYSVDEEGNKLVDYGTVEETIVAYEVLKDNYTLDDVYGGYFEDYLGSWEMTSIDWSDDAPYTCNVDILSLGDTAYQIVNMSGYNGYFSDTLYADYYESGGCIKLMSQTLPGQYQGEDVSVCLLDPDAGKIYASTAWICGGICSDGALAFVNVYSSNNICGLYYKTASGGLCSFYYSYGIQAASSTASNYVMKHRSEYVTAPAAAAAARPASAPMTMRKVSDKKAAPAKVCNLQPVVKSGRQVVSLENTNVSAF